MVPSQHIHFYKHHSGRGMFCHTVMAKYKLYQRTFSVVNHISSSISDANYAKSKETSLLSRISQSNREGRNIIKAQQKAIGAELRACPQTQYNNQGKRSQQNSQGRAVPRCSWKPRCAVSLETWKWLSALANAIDRCFTLMIL